jgi:hypothetical protein
MLRDPPAGLLWENCLANSETFAGTPFFAKTPEEFAPRKDLPAMNHELMRGAVEIPGLKIVFGSDALAGLHGRNAEDFINPRGRAASVRRR